MGVMCGALNVFANPALQPPLLSPHPCSPRGSTQMLLSGCSSHAYTSAQLKAIASTKLPSHLSFLRVPGRLHAGRDLAKGWLALA